MSPQTFPGPGGERPDEGPGERRDAPQPGELELRKALATMNDLEPPRDDLFVQRALLRGRARTARRRSTVLGAAAAVVVVGAIGGGGWMALTRGGSASSSAGSAAGAPEAAVDSGDKSFGGTGGAPASPGIAVPNSRDASTFLEGPATPATIAWQAVEPEVVAQWPDVFSGVYGADETNQRLVVALTRSDATVESRIRAAMPTPDAVSFTLATHSFAEKQRLADRITRDIAGWRSQGVSIFQVRQDGRADQVLVLADEGTSAGAIVQRYGDLVRVVPSLAAPTGKAPDGSTLPTLQR